MSAASTNSKFSTPTQHLSTWISSLQTSSIPPSIVVRAKYLILDGLACALVGAHLPWSSKAASTISSIESPGNTTVIGYDQKLAPLSSALLNSTFIQGFELDDWHSDAPLHSNAILLPALFGAAQHLTSNSSPSSSASTSAAPTATRVVSGSEILLAAITGYEVGPRVGLALHGAHILSTGWHSGAVFGPAASAAAASKLLRLPPSAIEDAFGIACTQACGLMSAQFGSEVKRMQHGFAARNGLLGAFLAQGGYIGIKGVFETEYGGFLKQFSLGNGKTPAYVVEELTRDLGVKWQTMGVRVKPYASMAGTHSSIDCVKNLQELYPEKMRSTSGMRKITIVLGEAAFHHGGWKATRPLTSTGAQMSNSYIVATQIIHGEVMPAQFRHDMLEHDELWRLVDLTECELSADLSGPRGRQSVTIEFEDGTTLTHQVDAPRGVDPPLSNEEILEKWRLLTRDVVDAERARKIENIVLRLEECEDISLLLELLGGVTKNPIA